MHVRPFERADTDAVVALWEACALTRAWNDPHADIERKLAHRPLLFLVGTEAGQVVGSVMAGYDGYRGSINYLAVSRRGSGRDADGP